ncbi:hypothetical protein [Chitiniphilus eburneus]|uniref:Uncharacterized protein n=1 Tax=Chitiniphilus eburneus TaxID=2571148 RepID=A0A4U0PXB7_9NEIS|nr:hypothetical protein [Chitiniphilus eburneus]TJZ73177.1 hypothetical protein FAZ21_11200 [Chitiniphilus eburneus]
MTDPLTQAVASTEARWSASPASAQLWAGVIHLAIQDLHWYVRRYVTRVDQSAQACNWDLVQMERDGQDALRFLFGQDRAAHAAGVCDVLDLRLGAIRLALARQLGTDVATLRRAADDHQTR